MAGSPPDSPSDGRAGIGLRPDPVLVVGIAGQRSLRLDADEASRLDREATALFAALGEECRRIAAHNADLFGPSPARLRLVTNLAGRTDIVMAAAARRAGIEIRAVLPYGPDACAADLGEEERRAFAELLAAAGEPFVLDGTPGTVQAHERAAASLLDVGDILVAYRMGEPGSGRAGTPGIVQEAVDRRMPVLLLPDETGAGVALIDDPDELLLPPVAADLPRLALADNVDRVLARAFAPPISHHERRALRDWLGEPRGPKSRRFEYRMLLRLAEPRPHDPHALSQAEEWRRARASAARVSEAAARAVDRLEAYSERIEEVAGHYGDHVRSGIVVRYLLAAIGSLLVAGFALIAPDFILAGVLIQFAVAGGTIAEATLVGRRRWNERWLDYRSLAERLRCDRFLQPIGIATVQLDAQTSAEDPAWMRWAHTRLLGGHWIGGRIDQAIVEHATRHLVEVEIASQIGYHHGAAIRARSLSRRLRYLGLAAVVLTLAASLALLATQAGDGSDLLLATVQVALLVLPAVYLAASGLRAEAGFDLQASRSEQALATLKHLRQRIDERPATLDRLVHASRAAASAMILDTVDWRVGVQRSRQPYRSTAPVGGGGKPASGAGRAR